MWPGTVWGWCTPAGGQGLVLTELSVLPGGFGAGACLLVAGAGSWSVLAVAGCGSSGFVQPAGEQVSAQH